MAHSLCFAPICSLKSSSTPVTVNSVAPKGFRINEPCLHCKARNFQLLKVKATDNNNQSTKSKSIVCPDCDGNGAILCTQCQGTGVNSVDHFNGRFKAGGLCWLCSDHDAVVFMKWSNNFNWGC
ncbi:Heat shock protein DnaJ, cysteine-rich domain superfamily [Sesbania bispinosa]|nr:Heat shock protein DnaJ, cysteine-rich domain superfamily [Sesbania bispinosa]